MAWVTLSPSSCVQSSFMCCLTKTEWADDACDACRTVPGTKQVLRRRGPSQCHQLLCLRGLLNSVKVPQFWTQGWFWRLVSCSCILHTPEPTACQGLCSLLSPRKASPCGWAVAWLLNSECGHSWRLCRRVFSCALGLDRFHLGTTDYLPQ